MAKVKYKRGSNTAINNTEIADGQILFATDTNQLYIDIGSTRKMLNRTGYSNITISILTTDWSGYTCTKAASGVTSNSMVICDISDPLVSCTAQGAGTLTFSAAVLPSDTVTVKAVVF